MLDQRVGAQRRWMIVEELRPAHEKQDERAGAENDEKCASIVHLSSPRDRLYATCDSVHMMTTQAMGTMMMAKITHLTGAPA